MTIFTEIVLKAIRQMIGGRHRTISTSMVTMVEALCLTTRVSFSQSSIGNFRLMAIPATEENKIYAAGIRISQRIPKGSGFSARILKMTETT